MAEQVLAKKRGGKRKGRKKNFDQPKEDKKKPTGEADRTGS